MIKKLDSGKWEVRCRENGKQPKRRFPTKKLAEEYELGIKNREARRRNGLPEEREPITYRELENKFRLQHATQSDKWHREMTAYSLTKFGDTLLHDLRADDIQAWLSGLNVGTKTKGHILQTMRQIFERGVDWGYLTRNPAGKRLVKPPKATPPNVNPFQSWNEVKKVAAKAVDYAALVIFACATGLRPEEWIALTWADIDFTKRTCRINKVVVDGQLRTNARQDRHGLPHHPTLEARHRRPQDSPPLHRVRRHHLPRAQRRLHQPRQLAHANLERSTHSSQDRVPAALPNATHVRHPRPRSRSRHLLGQQTTRAHQHPNHPQALRPLHRLR